MGLRERVFGRGDDNGDSDLADDVVDEIRTRPLASADEAHLDAVRQRLDTLGVDPGDLTAISTLWDDRLAQAAAGRPVDSETVVDDVAVAVGDHLVARGGYRWVVVADPFGIDLGVEPPRGGAPVVPHSLAAVRWMRRESGWVPGIVEHLVRVGRR